MPDIGPNAPGSAQQQNANPNAGAPPGTFVNPPGTTAGAATGNPYPGEGGDWWYNSNTGSVISDPTGGEHLAAKLGIGWHGPFWTKQDALTWYQQNAAQNPGWKKPAGLGANITNAVKKAVTAPLSWALQVTGLAPWFARGLKLLFGGVLIVAGVIKLTGTDKTLDDVLPLIGGPAGKLLRA